MGDKNNTFLTKYIKHSPRKMRQAVAKEQDNNPARGEKKPKRSKKAHSALKTSKQQSASSLFPGQARRSRVQSRDPADKF